MHVHAVHVLTTLPHLYAECVGVIIVVQLVRKVIVRDCLALRSTANEVTAALQQQEQALAGLTQPAWGEGARSGMAYLGPEVQLVTKSALLRYRWWAEGGVVFGRQAGCCIGELCVDRWHLHRSLQLQKAV